MTYLTPQKIELIKSLAEKYETKDFLSGDPSCFMHRYSSVRDVECVAFIAANLAFGRREQILSHVESILSAAGKDISAWIEDEKYRDFFPENQKSFYRMYTNHHMILFFDTLSKILREHGNLGEFFKNEWERKSSEEKYLHRVIADAFPADCALLPHSKNSAAKKVNMLLRWLVRDNSPVDLGLWTWYDKARLLLPLDTHVLQESARLGFLGFDSNGQVKTKKSANLNTAEWLTEICAEIFPDDPVKADFALFGSGVDRNHASDSSLF